MPRRGRFLRLAPLAIFGRWELAGPLASVLPSMMLSPGAVGQVIPPRDTARDRHLGHAHVPGRRRRAVIARLHAGMVVEGRLAHQQQAGLTGENSLGEKAAAIVGRHRIRHGAGDRSGRGRGIER